MTDLKESPEQDVQDETESSEQSFYSGSESSGSNVKSQATKAGLGKVASSSTPVGKAASIGLKALNFTKRNKTATISGTSILGGIIAIMLFLISGLPAGSMLLAVSERVQDHAFGPGNRNIVRQHQRIVSNIGDLRSQDGTRLNSRAQSINNVGQVEDTRSRNVGRVWQRVIQRSVVNTRAPRTSWAGVLRPRSDTGFRARSRLLGLDDARQRTRTRGLGQLASEQEIRDASTSDNPRGTFREMGRSATRGSLAAAIIGGSCVSAILEEELPDEGEISELLLETQADFFATSGQLADGKTVDDEQLVDVTEFLHFTEETLELDEDTIADMDQDQLSQIENDLDEALEEIEDAEAEGEDVDLSEYERDYGITTAEEVRSITNSAYYKDIFNQNVTGDEIDAEVTFSGIEDRLREGPLGYIAGFGYGINLMADSLLPGIGSTVFQQSCRVLLNPVVSIGLSLVELGTAAVTCLAGGAGCAAKIAAAGAAEAVGRGLSWAFMSLAYNSLVPEGPEEWFGYVGVGAELSDSEALRASGQPPADDSQVNEARTAHFEDLAKEDQERGFAWRYFSFENSRSVATQLAISIQTFQPRQLLKPITNFSSVVTNAIQRGFAPVRANEQQRNYDHFGLQKYLFTDEDLERYDNPVDNARFVEERIRCARNSPRAGDNCTNQAIEEGEIMEQIYQQCINQNTSPALHDVDDLCKTAELDGQNVRDLWVEIGLWTYNLQILESAICLSEDDPCAARQPTLDLVFEGDDPYED